MKTTILILTMLLSSVSYAHTIPSKKLAVAPSEIDKVIFVETKKVPGSSHEKVSIVVTDNGMSTDVSPRYHIYLGYASLAEMGNLSADFKVSDQAYQFISARKISSSIYEVKTVEYRDDGMYNVTLTINATKVFSDEKETRKNCNSAFCEQPIKSTIEVTEAVKKQE